jgi:FHA domain
MPEDESNPKKPPLSPDKLIQGVLSRLGETFDGLLGRQAKAAAGPATGELVSRTKKTIDSLVIDRQEDGKFAPHVFWLKVEKSSFSEAFKKELERELLPAVIDHINDNRYLTFAPLEFKVEPKYVTDIQVVIGFGEFAPKEKVFIVLLPEIEDAETPPEPEKPKPETVFAKFELDGVPKELRLRFEAGKRLNVGRTKENDLALEDQSVSKLHAALSFNHAGELVVADTGSTNGTFINKERLAYGKAFPLKEGDAVTFGTIEVFFEHLVEEDETVDEEPETVEDVSEITKKEGGPIRIELE